MTDTPDIKIHVVPETVPTTSAPFHPSATHIDALGMPVAFNRDYAYHPTSCCGATATGVESGVACRACYELIDPAYGNVPVEPIRAREA